MSDAGAQGARRFGGAQGALCASSSPKGRRKCDEGALEGALEGARLGALGASAPPRRRGAAVLRGVPLLGRSPGASLKKAPKQCRTLIL